MSRVMKRVAVTTPGHQKKVLHITDHVPYVNDPFYGNHE
jgi:hypothetical protein